MQADLWNGDPDVDATCRMIHQPEVKMKDFEPFTANAVMPFNSQNTFLHRDVLPSYMMLTGVGRIQDIWGAYILQNTHPDCVVYAQASVYQQRNDHDLVTDLADEIIQYQLTKELIENLSNWRKVLPSKTVRDFDVYQSHFDRSFPT